jgi:hypothetical protein
VHQYKIKSTASGPKSNNVMVGQVVNGAEDQEAVGREIGHAEAQAVSSSLEKVRLPPLSQIWKQAFQKNSVLGDYF